MSTEEPKRDALKVRNAIARDLREIEQLAVDLHAQALNSPNDRDFPGGTALHMSAPAVPLQDWDLQYNRKETLQRFDPATGKDRWEGPISPKTGEPTSNSLDPAVYQSETDAADHPLNVIGTWSRKWREVFDQPTGLTPTLSREVDYLRGQLDRICVVDKTGVAIWPLCFKLADDLHDLRRRMENTLHAGNRIDTDAAPCFRIDIFGNRCGGTLARVNLKRKACQHVIGVAEYVEDLNDIPAALAWLLAHYPHVAAEHRKCDQGGRDDLYRCLDCEKVYTVTEYWLAVSDNHERQTAG